MRLVSRVILILALACSARGDQLFVRNRPFCGLSYGVGKLRWVELEPMAKALGLAVKPMNGGFLILSDADSDQGADVCGPDLAVVDGNILALSRAPGRQPMLPLDDFCRLVGAQVIVHPEISTTDVYLDSKSRARIPSLKDHWGDRGLSRLPATPPDSAARACIQVFEAYAMLPPIRDLTELRSFNLRKGELSRFRSRLEEICEPSLVSRICGPIYKFAAIAEEASQELSLLPAAEFEQMMTTHPQKAQSFLACVSDWESARTFTVEILEARPNESGVLLLVTQTDPASHHVNQRKFFMAANRYYRDKRYHVALMIDQGPP